MEGFLGFLLFIGLFYLLGYAVNALRRTGHAVKETVKGNGSFKSNMKVSFQGMGAFQIRLRDDKIQELPNSPTVKEIQCKGLFPLRGQRNVGVLISVFDDTSGELMPVISMLEEFQEKNSVVFQHASNLGRVGPSQGFADWVSMGAVIPDILQPPHSGNRKIEVIVRLIDLNNPPQINQGFHQQSARGILWQKSLRFDWEFTEKGYEEAAEHREEATSIALKIGVAVSMADGSFDDEEGNILKSWVKRNIEPYQGQKKKQLKDTYNNALREGYQQAQNGELVLSQLTKRLNEIGAKRNKYEAVELAYDVMAADGVADSDELQTIKNVAKSLGLNFDEVNALRDKKLVGLDSSSATGADIEEILDINPNWSDEKIKKHLRKEFSKWNNRLNTLPEGEKRENAQKMLDLISEARDKYA